MKSATAISLICAIALASQVHAQDQPAPPNHEEIKAKLGWMIGTWERTTEEGEQQQIECKWILDKQFIQGTVATGNPLEEYLHVLIGWNPVEKKLTVTGFNRLGGQSTGKFIKTVDKEFHFAVKGVSAKGAVSLTLVYAHPDNDTLIVEYRDVVAGGENGTPMKAEMHRKKK